MSFAALTKQADAISAPYKTKIADDDAFWKNSPFDYIRRLPSRTKGTVGQTLARSVFYGYGYKPNKGKNSFKIGPSTIISRSSMVWETGEWKFQQVRDTKFDFLFCLGLYPDSASTWLIPKDELFLADGSLTDRDGWGRQHGGQAGTEDAWLIATPDDVPKWLGAFGGDISKISGVFKKYLP
jgi:hypothetical protein